MSFLWAADSDAYCGQLDMSSAQSSNVLKKSEIIFAEMEAI